MCRNTVTEAMANSPASKVTELSMILSSEANKSKTILLVEGPDDNTFYTRFISVNDVVISVLKGCYYMPDILLLVNANGKLRDKVIGIKDADFDRITGKKYNIFNLFLTDTHDWETMTLTNESERNISIESINRIENRLFDKVIKDLLNYSYLKLYNQVEICDKSLEGINFQNFAIKKIYDGDSSCDLDVCLNTVHIHNNNSRLPHYPQRKDIEDMIIRYPNPDYLQLTCGHDIVHGVVQRMIFLNGRRGISVGHKEVAMILRTSFTIELFMQTNLYKAIKKWAEEHGRNVWAA